MKNFLKILVFLVLCGAVFLGLNHIYRLPYEDGSNMETTVGCYNALYFDEKNTWDGVVLGTSIIDRAWVSPLAWADYGFTLYPLSSDSQPIVLSTDILDEVLKRQDIKLVVLDVHGITQGNMNTTDFRIRRVTDNLHSTTARISAVNHVTSFTLDHLGEDAALNDMDNMMSMYFPFIKYHSRTDLRLDDLTSPSAAMKGICSCESLAFRVRAQEPTVPTDECASLTSLQTDFLDELIDYVEEHDLEILFVSAPSGSTQSALEQINAALEYVSERGYTTLNMNTEEVYEAIGLDFSTDFYNQKHLNSRGAQKASLYLSEFINDNFDLEDKRGQETYEDWDEAYAEYVDFYETGWAARN